MGNDSCPSIFLSEKKQATHGGEWPVLAKSSGEEGKLVYMLGGVVLAVGL
jgi:hypothetical protein